MNQIPKIIPGIINSINPPTTINPTIKERPKTGKISPHVFLKYSLTVRTGLPSSISAIAWMYDKVVQSDSSDMEIAPTMSTIVPVAIMS